MSILVVGSIALDTINTQKASNKQLLGGSASHAAVAASFFSKVNLVGILGKDFPKRHLKLFNDRGINTEGLEIAPGKTFRWECQYEEDMNKRQTLSTDLGVFADFSPELPKTYIDTQYVLLANIAPALQLQVLDQVKKPRLVVADTMDLWLNTALPDLKKLLKKVDVFVLNDGEAMQLTGEDNVISAAKKTHKFGPKQVIVKKGEHGSILSGPDGLFIAPAFPLLKVVDPTGAGDSFAGAMVGYLAGTKGGIRNNLKKSVVYGSVVASFCCEGFGMKKTVATSSADIQKRFNLLKKSAQF